MTILLMAKFRCLKSERSMMGCRTDVSAKMKIRMPIRDKVKHMIIYPDLQPSVFQLAFPLERARINAVRKTDRLRT
jgi:hypothetical protein